MSSKLTRIKEELKEAGMTTTGHVIVGSGHLNE